MRYRPINISLIMQIASCFFILLSVLLTPPLLHAQTTTDAKPVTIDTTSGSYQDLFDELIFKHNFSRDELNALFFNVQKNQKVLDLMEGQRSEIPLLSYLSLIFAPALIEKGQLLLQSHTDILDRIEQEIGVDREFIMAIWAIETRYGQNIGEFNVFQTLNTLFAYYPRRSAFFRKELIDFLLICKENKLDPHQIMGSYAGAFGQTQFMPSSFREYAVSYDGDDTPDVFNSVPDILASIANYLKRHSWTLDAPLFVDLGLTIHDPTLIRIAQQGNKGRISWQQLSAIHQEALPKPTANRKLSIIQVEMSPLPGSPKHFIVMYPNFRAITAWNHSNRYAMTVVQLAQAIAAKQ